MRVDIAFFLVLIHSCVAWDLPPYKCTNGIMVRKEYRDISMDEWARFKNVLLYLQTIPSPDGQKYSEYDYWSSIHVFHSSKYHMTNYFLPWHRLYILTFERRLQQFEPSISIPYWNWPSDWRNATDSPIFKPEFGIDVDMKNSTGDCRYQRHFSPPHCLKRNYTPFKFPQLDNEDYIHLLIQKYTSDEVEFGQFAHEVENNAHNQLHLAIGGDFKEWWAPNDPLFWLFHAQVDKIWYDWQQANPLGRYNATELDTILEPFGVRFTDIINTKNLCYAYQDYSNAKPYTIRMA